MGSLFGGPKIDKDQKEMNKRRLASERSRASEEKKKALDQRISANNYGIRSLLGGSDRGGFA